MPRIASRPSCQPATARLAMLAVSRMGSPWRRRRRGDHALLGVAGEQSGSDGLERVLALSATTWLPRPVDRAGRMPVGTSQLAPCVRGRRAANITRSVTTGKHASPSIGVKSGIMERSVFSSRHANSHRLFDAAGACHEVGHEAWQLAAGGPRGGVHRHCLRAAGLNAWAHPAPIETMNPFGKRPSEAVARQVWATGGPSVGHCWRRPRIEPPCRHVCEPLDATELPAVVRSSR